MAAISNFLNSEKWTKLPSQLPRCKDLHLSSPSSPSLFSGFFVFHQLIFLEVLELMGGGGVSKVASNTGIRPDRRPLKGAMGSDLQSQQSRLLLCWWCYQSCHIARGGRARDQDPRPPLYWQVGCLTINQLSAGSSGPWGHLNPTVVPEASWLSADQDCPTRSQVLGSPNLQPASRDWPGGLSPRVVPGSQWSPDWDGAVVRALGCSDLPSTGRDCDSSPRASLPADDQLIRTALGLPATKILHIFFK